MALDEGRPHGNPTMEDGTIQTNVPGEAGRPNTPATEAPAFIVDAPMKALTDAIRDAGGAPPPVAIIEKPASPDPSGGDPSSPKEPEPSSSCCPKTCDSDVIPN